MQHYDTQRISPTVIRRRKADTVANLFPEPSMSATSRSIIAATKPSGINRERVLATVRDAMRGPVSPSMSYGRVGGF